MPTSYQSDEEDDPAPPPPCFSTPTKAVGSDGACHACQEAEETEAELDDNVEKQFEESTGKKRNYNPYLQYAEGMRWKTCPDSLLEPAQINHEMYTLMKKCMQQSCLMKAPGHEELPTDVGLWKQQRAEYYYNS